MRIGGLHKFQEGFCDLPVLPFSSHFEQGRFQPVQQRDELFQALIGAQVNVVEYAAQRLVKVGIEIEITHGVLPSNIAPAPSVNSIAQALRTARRERPAASTDGQGRISV